MFPLPNHEGLAHRMNSTTSTTAMNINVEENFRSYFAWPHHQGVLHAHIAIMMVAWVLVLPFDVMLAITRSSVATVSQLVFIILNSIGFLFGVIYSAQTPDLYTGEIHTSLGWLLTALVTTHALMRMLISYAPAPQISVSSEGMRYLPIAQFHEENLQRYSRDSGQGTEPPSPGINIDIANDGTFEEYSAKFEIPLQDADQMRALRSSNTVIDLFFQRILSVRGSSTVVHIIQIVCDIFDRLVLILGFITIAAGVAVYGGHFRGHAIYSGLAHFIKGGIFFWYGLLVLGRMMGAYADIGWSWNIRPGTSIVGSRKAKIPSAEFVESFLIFFYGSTNVFLEHLGSDDGSWSATDLEHASISVMFAGGGLCGMLIESSMVRSFLDAAITSASHARSFGTALDPWQQPKAYRPPLNPMPAIIIMLLGKMMSGHHQTSMVSTMLHAQWGGLFTVAAIARGLTYVLMYLSPPTSYLPARPPSELVVAFCLISGGLIFMGSNSDFVNGMEDYELDAMFLFTVIMGFTSFLMAWEILALAVKGWAVHWRV